MTARVLIIEDNAANMELMAYLLQAYGHEPLQATDGERGTELAQRQFPDLIICDVHLPKMDGRAVVRYLKNDPVLQRIPVIAVTALAMVGDREKLLADGFDAYISKPIEPEAFIDQVEKYLPQGKRSSGVPHLTSDESLSSVAVVCTRDARILVIDDTIVNSELIRSTLEPFGYTLTLAGSVQEGLAHARRARFDMILSDLHMPGEDGFSLIRAVKDDPELAEIPFMFLSSSFGSADDFERGMALGATQCVRRPIEPQALLLHVETCLQGKPGGGPDGNHIDR